MTNEGSGRLVGKKAAATKAVSSAIWSFDTKKARNFIGLFALSDDRTGIVKGIGPLLDICGGVASFKEDKKKGRKRRSKKTYKLPRTSSKKLARSFSETDPS